MRRLNVGRQAPGARWRPSLALVVLGMLAIVACLPLLGLSLVRMYENQLVRQAEAELADQGAAVAAFVARDIAAEPERERMLGAVAPAPALPPYEASLDLAADPVLGRRPEPLPAARTPTDPALVAIGGRLDPVLARIRDVSLTGFRIADRDGTIFAGSGEKGASLAGIEEVDDALKGRFRVVMRVRISKHPQPPLYSLSRGTGVRVFAATPILVDGRVAGVVYASRTSNSVMRLLYAERGKVALALGSVLGAILAIAVLFVRLVGRPIRDLVDRSVALGRGEAPASITAGRHGTREVAMLAAGQEAMARRLRDRSDYVANFAAHVSHELKTPLTAIQGAAELLRDDCEEGGGSMDPDARRRFLDNIASDAARLGALLGRLRDLARAENAVSGGRTDIDGVAADLGRRFPGLLVMATGATGAAFALSPENAGIVFGHLADNAARHGAGRLSLDVSATGATVSVLASDDGPGIPARDLERVFEPFYTTRRESGGTGMGLGIVRALLSGLGGGIEAWESRTGAAFLVTLPSCTPPAR